MNCPAPPQPDDEVPYIPPSRRRLLSWLVGGLSALLAGFIGIPFIAALLTPVLQPKSKGAWVALGPVADFPAGTFTAADYLSPSNDGWMKSSMQQTVWVQNSESGVIALSAICTHAGCRVGWHHNLNRFVCPCHGGQYDASGRVISGPPPRPLTRFMAKVEGGTIYVKSA
ncbi:MAG: ubiquinol-cytochrome c reductase iron-sulfur subunit [Armatimonadetes bacterium]|nr:ubiquinol-cytochrome c reductase iron-sulfur subunit [Armatimonadota bacterium]MDE2206650.1 ubiquinol-cytochrome c reductase iron-sulfur subunit [Armatimonadota bacterium]